MNWKLFGLPLTATTLFVFFMLTGLPSCSNVSHAPASGEQFLFERKIFVDERGRPIDPYVSRQVKNTITANARDAQVCFNKYVEDMGDKIESGEAKGDGELHLDWTVKRSGLAVKVRTVFSQFQNEDFEECMQKAVSSWDFPPPDLDTYADHRFRFAMQAPTEEEQRAAALEAVQQQVGE